ncbi:MAG: hypothetical protein ACREEQ_11895, partial [Caulobacteraceae bacterium]
MTEAAAAAAGAFAALLQHARDDPAVTAFWLGGSRGKGRGTAASDYDCVLILADGATSSDRRAAEAFRAPGLEDLRIMALGEFERYAAWGSPEAWDRYSFVHVSALVDKTGAVQPMIDAKARVPAGEAEAFIGASLDHLVNQAYRALKCLRDGDALASRLE